MNAQIVSSLILGGSSIISSIILAWGVVKLAKHRKTTIRLCENIQRYHELEHKLVACILELSDEEASENVVIKRKGMLRNELLGSDDFDSFITAKEAVRIKRRYFG